MATTPRPARNALGRPSLGEPSRISRLREQSPGGDRSVGSIDDTSMNNRMQAGAGGHPRRSASTRGNVTGRSSRDPRPVGDKAYASLCARNVVEFCAANGFGRTITYEKFLREPMTKDFSEIFKFLLARLDPQLEIAGKIEDEVPLIMRRLRYPVEVNKSKLQSICGPNTWPQLLAVLDWLICLIQVNDGLIQPLAECSMGLGDNGDCESDHHMLRTLHENYLQFLGGSDDHSVEERLRQVYQDRLGAVQLEVERLQECMAGKEQELQEFRSKHERLLEMQAAPKQLEIEADRLRSAIQAQEVRAQRAEEESLEVEAQERTLLTETHDLELKAGELQAQVDSQAYSKKDVERLKCERAHLQRMFQDLKNEADKHEQAVFDLGIEESRLVETFERTARYVNDKVVEVFEDASVADGRSKEDFLVLTDVSGSAEASIELNVDEPKALMEASVEAKREAVKQEEAVVQQALEEQKAVHDEVCEVERELRRLKGRLEQLARLREEYRVWSNNELEDARQTAEELEHSVRQASVGTAAPSVRDAAEVDELRLRIAELSSQCEGERTIMEDKIRREEEKRELVQQNMQQEMQLTLENMDQLRENVEKRVTELSAADVSEANRHRSRGGC